jgi:hypothetical protein
MTSEEGPEGGDRLEQEAPAEPETAIWDDKAQRVLDAIIDHLEKGEELTSTALGKELGMSSKAIGRLVNPLGDQGRQHQEK